MKPNLIPPGLVNLDNQMEDFMLTRLSEQDGDRKFIASMELLLKVNKPKSRWPGFVAGVMVSGLALWFWWVVFG